MSLARRTLLTLATAAAGCASEPGAGAAPRDAGADAPDGAAALPTDDDTARLAHCTFEAPPARAALPAPPVAALRAGVASRTLDLPVGVPMGGYAARSDAFGAAVDAPDGRVGRWTATFVPSAGAHDALRADALAFEAGEERFVLVRADVPLVTDATVFAVERALGAGWRGRVILAASHSHAGYVAWQPSSHLVPGTDRIRRDLHDRAVAVLAGAAQDAIDDLAPARVGIGVAPDLDPESRVSHDRRGDNDDVVGPDGNRAGASKDPVVWALRVDDAQGRPRAALVSWPLHGTIGIEENPLLSTDAPGAVQRGLGAALGYPVFHLQGAAGDVSPGGHETRARCPDGVHCFDGPRLELIAAEAAALGAPLIAGITTRERGTLEIVTRGVRTGKSVAIRRETRPLWYPPWRDDAYPDGVVYDDAGAVITPLDEFNVWAGAALCGKPGGSLGIIYGTEGVPGYSSCADIARIGSVFGALFEIGELPALPLCDTVIDTVSAVRFSLEGDPDRLLLTVPGEPTAPLTAYLRGRSPAGAANTLVVGYAQDYLGYVLTVEDWLRGGYEPSLNVWGPLEGEQLLEGLLGAAALAVTPEREDPEAGSLRFDDYRFLPDLPVRVAVDDGAGTVPDPVPAALFLPEALGSLASAQPDAVIERARGLARFVWVGGDPAIDFPEVTVEREASPGTWEPLTDRHGVAASSRHGAVFLTVTPEPLAAAEPTRHHWVASFQPVPPDPLALDAPLRPWSLPLGRYRLVARGTTLGSAGSRAYVVASQAFEVVAAGLGTASATLAGTTLTITARVGDPPGLRALGATGWSDAEVPLPGPWSVTLTRADATTDTLTGDPGTSGQVALTLAAGAAPVEVEVRDGAGNGGRITITP